MKNLLRLNQTRLLVLLVSIFVALPLAAQEQWRSLFDGKSLDGWQQVGPGNFVIEDGLLKSQGGMGLLWFTAEKFSDVELSVLFRNPGGKNSGVFIRIPEPPTEPWMPVNKGYEVQIDNNADEFHTTGVLYSLTKALAQPTVVGDWNTLLIRLEGDRTLVKVNNVVVTDFTEGDAVPEKKEWYEPDRGPRPQAGFIGVQNHGNEDTVYFREISVRSLR